MFRPSPLTCLSIEDYLAGERLSQVRHEYVAGPVYAITGVGERHNRIALNLAFHLRAAARGGPCGVYMSDMKLRIRQGERFYYPDVTLVYDSQDQAEYYKDSPCLLAEVLSPSTEKTDRREKCSNSHYGDITRYRVVVEPARSFVA